MVKSGVTVGAECISVFKEWKFKKDLDCVIYRLTPNLQAIEVAHAPPKNSYQEVKEWSSNTNEACGSAAPDYYKFFYEKLTEEGNCGYGIIEIKWMKKGLGLQASMVMICWIPENSKIKPKMMYSSSKEDLKKKLEGIEQYCYEFTDLTDFNFKDVMERISKGTWDENAPVPEPK